MKSSVFHLSSPLEEFPSLEFAPENGDLVIVHGALFCLEDAAFMDRLRRHFPNAVVCGSSTAGEIIGGQVKQNSIVVAALQLEKTRIREARGDCNELSDRELGRKLARDLGADDLKFMLLYSEGLSVDCDELVLGLHDVFGDEAPPIFGGLAGDGMEFRNTIIIDSSGVNYSGAVGIGFYGDSLEVSSATSVFNTPGELLEVTRSEGNIVHELEGRPALDVYREVLGKDAESLPGASILFPFILLDEDLEPLRCRTPHEILEEEGSILFAGSVPEGFVRLVNMTDPNKFLEDATAVANSLSGKPADLCIIVNCAVRKEALGAAAQSREVENIHAILGSGVPTFGYYSYGEIGTCRKSGQTETHNQAVNLAILHEV